VLKSRAVVLALAAGTIAVGVVAAPYGASAQVPGCTPATNVEAILDDSGSMVINDPNRLRKEGMDLIVSKQSNDSLTLGAVEFGSQAASLFKPGQVAANRSSMLSTLNARIQADNGSTNYNAAFDLAKAENPNAQARIFLTDGAHNVGPYANGHQGGPKTYVVGFGAASDDRVRLQQIASETGGQYFEPQNASTLNTTMNQIDNLIHCRTGIIQYVDNFTSLGQSKTHGFRVRSTTRSLNFEVTWPDAANAFTVRSFVQKVRGQVVARGGATRIKKLRVTKRSGATFTTVRVRGLQRGGRLTFKVRATKLGSPSTATTQVAQSRSR
jgi:von Willebrand factor type A domain